MMPLSSGKLTYDSILLQTRLWVKVTDLPNQGKQDSKKWHLLKNQVHVQFQDWDLGCKDMWLLYLRLCSLVFGRAITKTITCTKIWQTSSPRVASSIKASVQEHSRGVREPRGWNVHKAVPSICILFSREPLDPQELGH